MNYYVVENYEEAISAINLLSNSAKGRAQFFVLSNYEKPHPTLPGKKGFKEVLPTGGDLEGAAAIPALSVIEVEGRYSNLCNYLLKDVYLVNDSAENDLNPAVLGDILFTGKSAKFNK